MRGLVHAGIVAARGAGIPTAAVSTDGQTWRSLVPTRTAGEWQAALFEANGPAWRYLRVDTGNSPLQLSQISVWPGAAPGPPPTVGADRGPAGLGNGALPASHGGHRSLAVWAVVAAILLVLVGAGLVRVRRQPAARAG
jgi:hypothetical protein